MGRGDAWLAKGEEGVSHLSVDLWCPTCSVLAMLGRKRKGSCQTHSRMPFPDENLGSGETSSSLPFTRLVQVQFSLVIVWEKQKAGVQRWSV